MNALGLAIHTRQRASEGFGVIAPLATGAAIVLQPTLVLAALGGGIVALLAVVSVETFVLAMLLARNLASGESELVLAAGLNAGALIGLVVLGATAVRLGRSRYVKGLVWTLVLSFALLIWFSVGIEQFSLEPSLTREIVRSLSILALALVAANAATGPLRDRLLSAVLLAAVIPAIIALTQIATGGVHVRADGTFAHPNEAAAVFALTLAIALWRWLDTGDARLYLPLVLLFGVALLGTQSLGGISQALVTLLAYALLTRRFRTRSMVAIAAGLVFIVVFLLSPAGSQRLEELDTTTSYSTASRGGEYTTNSLDWRFYNWAQEIRAWKEKPLVGYGLGSTATIVNPGGNIPHSDVLRLLVETGIIGFVFFGAALLVLCLRLYDGTRRAGRDGAYATLALAVISGLLVHGLVNNVSTQTATMYSTAIIVGCALASSPTVRKRYP